MKRGEVRPRRLTPVDVAHGDDRVRVLIANGGGLARRMTSDTLQEAGRIRMVAAARDGTEALGLTAYARTVLIVDTALPPAGCVELISTVLLGLPETRILTVSSDEDQLAPAALGAGSIGHISKDIDPSDLVRLVLLAAEGGAVVPRRLVMPLLRLLREAPDAAWRPGRSRLTTREWEVVEMLGDDHSTERIAQRLVLSPTTVTAMSRACCASWACTPATTTWLLRRGSAATRRWGTKPPKSLRRSSSNRTSHPRKTKPGQHNAGGHELRREGRTSCSAPSQAQPHHSRRYICTT